MRRPARLISPDTKRQRCFCCFRVAAIPIDPRQALPLRTAPGGIKAALFARTVSARVPAAWPPPLQPLAPFSSAVSCRVPCRRTRRRRGTTRIGTSTWDQEGSGSSERVFRDFGPWGGDDQNHRTAIKIEKSNFFQRAFFFL